MPNEENSGILIYAQKTREGYLHTVFFELLNKAKELAQKLGLERQRKSNVRRLISNQPKLKGFGIIPEVFLFLLLYF